MLYCKECKVVLSLENTEFDVEEAYCRDCMKKKYGDAYLDWAENSAEDIDDIDKDEGN